MGALLQESEQVQNRCSAGRGGRERAGVGRWQMYPDIFLSNSAGCGRMLARESIEPCFAK